MMKFGSFLADCSRKFDVGVESTWIDVLSKLLEHWASSRAGNRTAVRDGAN